MQSNMKNLIFIILLSVSFSAFSKSEVDKCVDDFMEFYDSIVEGAELMAQSKDAWRKMLSECENISNGDEQNKCFSENTKEWGTNPEMLLEVSKRNQGGPNRLKQMRLEKKAEIRAICLSVK